MRQNNILQVFYDDRQVGTLVLNADHKVAFEYTDTWLEEGFSIISSAIKKTGICPDEKLL